MIVSRTVSILDEVDINFCVVLLLLAAGTGAFLTATPFLRKSFLISHLYAA